MLSYVAIEACLCCVCDVIGCSPQLSIVDIAALHLRSGGGFPSLKLGFRNDGFWRVILCGKMG